MKKALIIIALVAMVIAPVAAFEFKGVGLEAGTVSGITGNFDLKENNTGYITVNFSALNNAIGAGFGYEYKASEFNIEKAKFDVNVGALAIGYVAFGENTVISATGAVTGAIAFPFTIKDLGNFTTYLRLGIGANVAFTADGIGVGIAVPGALGLIYHL